MTTDSPATPPEPSVPRWPYTDSPERPQDAQPVPEPTSGDAIHYLAEVEHSYENASKREEASMIWVCTERNAT